MKPRLRCIVSIDIDESRRHGPVVTVSQILSMLAGEIAARSKGERLGEAKVRERIKRCGGVTQSFTHAYGMGTIHIAMQEDGPLCRRCEPARSTKFSRSDKREAVRRG